MTQERMLEIQIEVLQEALKKSQKENARLLELLAELELRQSFRAS